METEKERRRERRLHYHWPVWFAEDFNDVLTQGQMLDVCSSGAAFTCHSGDECPYLGEQITARFSTPHFIEDDAFEMASFTRTARVCRIDEANRFLCRVAVQFAEPLPFKPGEQGENEFEIRERLKAVTI